MLDLTLVGSAFLMGAAGSVHCAAMCGAPCAAVTGGARWPAMGSFQVGRLVGYATGGAIAAASVAGLVHWGETVAWLRPLWLGLHLVALALGLFLLWRGEQPGWLQRLWPERPPAVGTVSVGALREAKTAWSMPVTAGSAGLAWLAWPCGLLQSALVVAALASGPWQGAAVMAAFALASSPGLLAGPWLLRRLSTLGRGGQGGGMALAGGPGMAPGVSGGPGAGLMLPVGAREMRWATRISGGLLMAGACWALGHGVWAQIRAYCG
jgi:uncharacterized protein